MPKGSGMEDVRILEAGESRPFQFPGRRGYGANPADTSMIKLKSIYPDHVFALPHLRVGRALTLTYSSFLFVAAPSSSVGQPLHSQLSRKMTKLQKQTEFTADTCDVGITHGKAQAALHLH